MALQAGHAAGSHIGTMQRARWQVQPIADPQEHVTVHLRKMEGDGALYRDKDLVVGMTVLGVALERAIRPGRDLHSLGIQQRADLEHRHAAATPMKLPTR
jgi:hypothetical protein